MKFNTLTKAIRILDLFLSKKTSLTEDDISSFMKMPRSTTYKYLSILRQYKLLDYDYKSGEYRLGSKCFEYSEAFYSQSKIDKIALPFMKRLYNEVQETVILGVLSNNRGYCLEAVGKEDGLGFIVRRGSELPLHCGASGQLLLAFTGEEDTELFLRVGKLKKYTNKTITDPDKLRKKLSAIKKAGYAYSEGELHAGGNAIAAPVFDHLGNVCASLSVAGPVQRMMNDKIEQIKKLVIKYANEITHSLSFSVGSKD
jgi:DNA-binding IclR family transcriptional regulator